ncbi:MAG: hypothetical protein CO066_06830 [Comamonadaceae bacterium CG_4_9_14_0_8_um_filter_60_18]|nr:MAG: hypothetical protein AUK52_08590 [Comamonadaceae bacterium CG2_30_60_41]PIW10237.1 MAG: hypothetical protein COW39_01480 [Comamonadaceae bacterium CG17_big_fil_post_rev_8_21_14_2_50_60_13]PIY26670.1 MAG: hypothetical protein COZ10_01950 [Comamonadaceae bacterium CG_4_10_14_3_um_filter_60_75]PJC14058.1 MAG: hypothetical protein CO066_06830 [Comamonadaceae bacterium CG_4_9_14_0_8_um_filter_60_18]
MASASYQWRFFRAGGFDQVQLDRAADLLALGELDQKLWVALSCPVQGIEFDARSLQFIDSDNDGHVRPPELIAAIGWAKDRLVDADVLVKQLDGVPINGIRDDDDAGKLIKAAAQALATELGKGESDLLTVAETSAAQASHAARALAAWEAAGKDALPLGDATAVAHSLVSELDAKVVDFFTRCDLAAFDTRAGDVLNPSEDALKALAPTALQAGAQAISDLPLAHVNATGKLPLDAGLNPAWAGRVAALRDTVVQPLLGVRDDLTAADWQAVKDQLAPYTTWLASKPDPAAEGDGVRSLEKLSRYVRDLQSLANNFVAFRDFYTRQGKATFQIGTLYLDGRACELCVAVNDAAKHAALAGLSRVCLVYCDCARGAEKLSIAAAFTAGDSDQLMVGRNGVFYDRQGRDWDATIAKIVEHPISLRQAFWSPYKQAARMVGTQLQKMAAAKAKAADDKLAGAAVTAASKGVGGKAEAPPPFDVGKFAGIFAAIGLALGAIGTMVVSLVGGLFGLKWWQIPLALLALMLLISAPAVILAWFKLRSRNLGPILDANGWAVNARARINIPFGTSLTQLAKLPDGAERTLTDPYADKPSRVPYLVAALVVLVLAVWIGWFRG